MAAPAPSPSILHSDKPSANQNNVVLFLVLFAFSLLGPPPLSSPARHGGEKEVGAGLGTRNPELGTTFQRRGSTSLPMRSRLARSSPGELSQRFLSPKRARLRMRSTMSEGVPATPKRSRKYSVSPS